MLGNNGLMEAFSASVACKNVLCTSVAIVTPALCKRKENCREFYFATAGWRNLRLRYKRDTAFTAPEAEVHVTYKRFEETMGLFPSLLLKKIGAAWSRLEQA